MWVINKSIKWAKRLDALKLASTRTTTFLMPHTTKKNSYARTYCYEIKILNWRLVSYQESGIMHHGRAKELWDLGNLISFLWFKISFWLKWYNGASFIPTLYIISLDFYEAIGITSGYIYNHSFSFWLK